MAKHSASSSDYNDMIWSALLHLGYNMWGDRKEPTLKDQRYRDYVGQPFLRCDMKLWRELCQRYAAAGANQIIIDLGEGVRYESHPELAVKGSLSPAKLRKELDFIRGLGLEPIPKLNFSATHDLWLGPYSLCLSTDTYYGVCRDLIDEVITLFDTPRFFHIGMDEETAEHQRYMAYAVLRQHELWWHDLYFLVDRVERRGVRAWMWSDYAWNHAEYTRKCPRTVLQSNWYYGEKFGVKLDRVRTYNALDKAGFEQVPTGSNWVHYSNFPDTVKYCRRHLKPGLLKGFMQTPWYPTMPYRRREQVEAIAAFADGRTWWHRAAARA